MTAKGGWRRSLARAALAVGAILAAALAQAALENHVAPPYRLGGVTLQIVRDWVVRFNAEGPDGLLDRKAAGPTPKLDDAQRRALAARVEAGPIPAVHGVVRWRLVDLAQWVWEEFRLSVSVQTLSRELRALGYRKLSARPAIMRRTPTA